jgi:hypothetical protein
MLSWRAGLLATDGLSSERREEEGRATLGCSKSCLATFCSWLEGLRECDEDGGAWEAEAERLGEEGGLA